MKRRNFFGALFFVLWLPGAALGNGNWSGFLRLDGVTGESQDTNHTGWMDVSTVGAGNITNSNPASLPGVPGGPSQGAICFLKTVDKASPSLKLDCAKGTLIPSGNLDLTGNGTSLIQFFHLDLTNVFISSVSQAGGANGENRPQEEVCLLAQVVSWKYTQFSAARGLPRNYINSFWDFQNKTGASGTNNPVFVATGIRQAGGIELRWQATAGKRYCIYAVTRLDAPFSPLAVVTAATTGPMNNTQPLIGNVMFFIVEELP
jgi:type VI secretion system secreted protein Hcp